ncbi:MAG: YbhB/YbcL family Raf kinase inhibitor-like protein [Bryobacteraceae bacterium]|nr:YbhB/YbcL family Raf kinase inhibitor-like protein [Bryobacteraceae bacterium]
MSFRLKVEGFEDGGQIPRRYTCEGEDVSPRIEWMGAPAVTRSFALIVEDPDAPAGTWNHWLLWDIPATMHALPEALVAPGGVRAGTNDFGRPGYGGPCPPKGHGPHRYFIRLHALDVAALGLAAGAKRSALDALVQKHVIATAEYMGRYERR